tara:strand:+ start:3685 stop:3894 length:210 start_codon:yes stop_codon:yes gene_type:complete
MKFTNSQKHFINDSIRRELRENDRFIKWLTDTAEKENNIVTKRSYNSSIEIAVKRLEELEEMMRMINEL